MSTSLTSRNFFATARVRRRAAKAVLAALAVFLNVAAPGAAAEPATTTFCGGRTVAEISLRAVVGFVVVSATIGGTPVSLLLDTGAEAALLTPEAVTRLGLSPDPTRRTLVEGTGGRGEIVPHAMLDGLALGAYVAPTHSVAVAPLPGMPRIDPPVAGLLAADLLPGFDVEIDFAGGRLVLREPAAPDCAAPMPFASHEPVALRRSGDRLIVTARLDGQKLDALVDTGALSVVLDTDAALRLGVTSAALARDPGGIAAGADMRELTFHWHRFASLAIGPVTARRPVITVTRVTEQTPLLLGASWFMAHRVGLSYATGRMFIAR